MECFNCKCKMVKATNDLNTKNIISKYKDYIICSTCKDILYFLGFLGDVNDPIIVYKKEKVNIDLNKINKNTKYKKNKNKN
jgi:hypothetical protein